MLFNDFSSDSQWPSMQYTEEEWRNLYAHKFLHWLFLLVGVSNLSIEPDELHVWHLGCLQYFIGSIFTLLAFEIMPDAPTDNFKRVWRQICEFYAEHSVDTQYGNLSISSFTSEEKPLSQFPRLKGKGAEANIYVGCSRKGLVSGGHRVR